MIDEKQLFADLGGDNRHGLTMHAPTYQSEAATRYLTRPGIVLKGMTIFIEDGMEEYFAGFDEKLLFQNYTYDLPLYADGSPIPQSSRVIQFAGQGCYGSWGPKRTMRKDVRNYVNRLVESAHGSVLEHASFGFWLYGVSRSLSHELVARHRFLSVSQLSQRYVGEDLLRFVERPEFADNPVLHDLFLKHIDRTKKEYHLLCEQLWAEQQLGHPMLQGESGTDLRKKVHESARSILPNDTETALYGTANIRHWRHIIDLRATTFVDPEIRNISIRLLLCLKQICPLEFADYTIDQLDDGSYVAKTAHRHV